MMIIIPIHKKMMIIVHATYEKIFDYLHVKIAEVAPVMLVLQQWNLAGISVMIVEVEIINQSSIFIQLQKLK
jgi:hypothetical protein